MILHLLTRYLDQHRKAEINRRLEATLKPNPGLRSRRMAQLTPEGRERYRENIRSLGL